MRRRDFIKTLVGTAVACPFAAPAQTAERVRLIGLLNILGSDDPEALVRLTIFQRNFAFAVAIGGKADMACCSAYVRF
jgi:hypothetical protein